MPTRPKILIVDDVDTNRDILVELLEDDFELKEADSGEAALAVLNEFKPDGVLLDIMMPGIDGYEVCKRIRAMPEYKSIVIYLLTGRASKTDYDKGMACGANEYLFKPFDLFLLRNQLLTMFDVS